MTMKAATIRDTQANNLQISEDTEFDGKSIAVLLYRPVMDHHQHHHIELDRSQAEALHQWLHEYLERSSS